MRIVVKSVAENPTVLLRRAGYAFQRAEGNEMSFIRPLAASGYPRFHCYAKVEGISLTVNFHLDQKKHTYGEETRHHGEYANDGPVREEAAHLLQVFGTGATVVGEK